LSESPPLNLFYFTAVSSFDSGEVLFWAKVHL